jgi:hypothetical protein
MPTAGAGTGAFAHPVIVTTYSPNTYSTVAFD